MLDVSGGGGGKAAGGANILGWCGCGEDCKAGGKLWGVFWLAAKDRGKVEAAAAASAGGGGWWGMCKELAGGPWGLVPGVLLLLLL